jgi:spore coat protein A
VDPLPIPGVIEPVSGEPGGVAEYEIPVVQFQHQYHRDLPPTTVWGYAGVTPGPRIEASVGMPVTVTWINDLRDESGALRSDHVLPVDPCLHGPDMAGPAPRIVTHLHGGHVPAESDGYPEHTILPGETVTYEYPNLQPPAQLWFHDHALGITRLNVYMGMAGLYTLRDEAEAALDLPSGAYEIPLVIQDRSFNADGSLSYPALWQEHVFGDVLVVNGKVWPYLEVGRGKYRFRLLNGSNSRTYALALSDGATFHQIGTDGGLLGAPVAVGGVTLAPGERADVVIDFAGYAPGTELILTNTAPAPFPGEPGVGVIPDVLKLLVTSAGGHTAPLPGVLRPLEPLLEETALRSRALELRKFAEACAGSWWLIDGLGWDEVTERPRLDTTEVWSFVNRSGVMHPMHMHLVLFQVLDRQAFEVVDGVVVPVGEPILPSPAEAGWKDTVQAPPGEITRVIARFERFAGLFPYHCHILEHEDHEMMRQFQTLPACPGDTGGDGVTDVQDLVAVVLAWGTADPFADVTADGVVDVQDLVAVLLGWGPCPQ